MNANHTGLSQIMPPTIEITGLLIMELPAEIEICAMVWYAICNCNKRRGHHVHLIKPDGHSYERGDCGLPQ